jgi:hypothetical protein
MASIVVVGSPDVHKRFFSIAGLFLQRYSQYICHIHTVPRALHFILYFATKDHSHIPESPDTNVNMKFIALFLAFVFATVMAAPLNVPAGENHTLCRVPTADSF